MIRLLRGQVAIRELDTGRTGLIWHQAPGQRQTKTHRGVVLGMGAPALHLGHEVSHAFQVGDTVQFHITSNEDACTSIWPADGEKAIWVPHGNVDGVWEAS